MRKFAAIVGVALALFAAPSFATSPADRLNAYITGLSTWTTEFTQSISDANGKLTRSASGRFSLQRPGKFRWDYLLPAEQLVLADGRRLWFYDKDLAQANVRALDQTLASTPALLLSGSGSVADAFEVSALPAAEGLDWFLLKPKHDDTDFRELRLAFKGKEPRRMVLADKLNQITRLDFTSSKRNVQFSSGLFSFTPPVGVDVIGGESGR
jgi:outer membrane lipoprotein carrier protein